MPRPRETTGRPAHLRPLDARPDPVGQRNRKGIEIKGIEWPSRPGCLGGFVRGFNGWYWGLRAVHPFTILPLHFLTKVFSRKIRRVLRRPLGLTHDGVPLLAISTHPEEPSPLRQPFVPQSLDTREGSAGRCPQHPHKLSSAKPNEASLVRKFPCPVSICVTQ